MRRLIVGSMITLFLVILPSMNYAQEVPSIQNGTMITFPNGDVYLDSWDGDMYLNSKDLILNGWIYSRSFSKIYFHASIIGINPQTRIITFQLYFNLRDTGPFYPLPDRWDYYGTETIIY